MNFHFSIAALSVAILALSAATNAARADAAAAADEASVREYAPNGDELTPERKANLTAARTLFEAAKAQGGESRRAFFGGVADRAARTVTLYGEATGLKPGDIAEFGAITQASAHDYESLFVVFADPADIAAAVEFLGVPRGRPASGRDLAFWPKGERVRMTVVRALSDGSSAESAARPVGALIRDAKADRTLDDERPVYCGSLWTTKDGSPRCLAEDDGPGSLLSSYNEPATLFDMPFQSPQTEVYERYLVSANYAFAKGDFVRIEISPEPAPDGAARRVLDLALAVSPKNAAPEFRFAARTPVQDGAASALEYAGVPEGPLPMMEFLRFSVELAKKRDPFVQVSFDDGLTVDQAAKTAEVLRRLDTPRALRIEAPPEGQLYYQAFLPRAEWANRADRTSQPCELRFARGADGALSATLVKIEEIWSDKPDELRPDLKVSETPAAAPDAFAAQLEATGVDLTVLLVFAPKDARLGEILPRVRAVVKTHPNVYIFGEER